MLSLREELAQKLPTLRSIEDLKNGFDLDQAVNLSRLYHLGIDNSHDEHIARMGVWHPSSVGYCRRAQVLQFIRTMPTDRHSKRVQSIFEMGHLVHDLVQTRLERLGPKVRELGPHYLFRKEVPCDRETDRLFLDMRIAGTTDGILKIWTSSWEQRSIIEIKSQGNDIHTELLKREGAFPNHLMQSHLYAWRFDCPLIYVFYYNKNNSKREIRLHAFDYEIFDAAVNYFSECDDFVMRGQLPPREETYLECSDCPYRSMCGPKCLTSKAQRANAAVIPRKGLRR